MGNYKDDNNQDFGTFLFLILFLVFILASSGNPESHTSPSAKYPLQNELVFGDISSNRFAIICNAVSIPDLQKYCESDLHNAGLNAFSIQNKLSDYNRRITQKFILIQKTLLSFEPVHSWSLYLYPPSNEDDNLPDLS